MLRKLFYLFLMVLLNGSVLQAQIRGILSENQKLYIGEISGINAKQFNKSKHYGEDFGLSNLTQSRNLIEIRCYESNLFLVNHCTILIYDTSFSIYRKVIQYRPYDTTKYFLQERQSISSLNPDTIISKLINLGIFSFKPLRGQDKKRMVLNKNNQLEQYEGLIGVTDGTSYRIDIKIGNTYKSIYTNTSRIILAEYFPDDIDIKREKEIVNLLEAKPILILKSQL